MRMSLLAIGECMVELSFDSQDSLNLSFAGDTYNSLLYAKRWEPQLDCSLFTAIGHDKFSDLMLSNWQKHNIDTSLILRNPEHNAGIYAIQTDAHGERKFDYWRQNSAATTMMRLHDMVTHSEQWPQFDIVYFSGISLAILSDDDKALFFELLQSLRYRGSKVAFDPNYRPKMWKNIEHARHWLQVSYQHSDIVFPGADDHLDLLGNGSVEHIVNYCLDQKVEEVVIKAGKLGVYGFKNGQQTAHIPFTPAPIQLDTTAAGDSFSGIYMASRIRGDSIEKSIQHACHVAGIVVQHRGAIISDEAFNQCLLTQ